MLLDTQTASVNDFRDDIAGHLRRLRRAKSPTLLTQNGKGAAVMMSLRQFQSFAAALDFVETVEAIEAGRREDAQGRTKSWRKSRAALLRVASKRPKPR
ncbi:MAG: type II toxin-antitoxin system Phd/YefM family antitoxin [Phycisphaerales bacterium]|nr:type II toxin-antitoxin system Phd/YefM family antitoxin [Phycisphaerales bacterium]